MKIRNGLVSNSSSSSFVFMCPVNVYKQAIKKVHPFVKYLVESRNPNRRKILGIDCMVAIGTIYTEEDPYIRNYTGPVIDNNGEELEVTEEELRKGFVDGAMETTTGLETFEHEALRYGECFFEER